MSMYNDASLALIPSAVGDGVVYNARPVEVLGAELVTGLTNGTTYPFDTFTSSGRDVTAAIKTSGFAGCITNGVTFTSGDKVRVRLTYNKTSGNDLRVLFSSSQSGAGISVSDTQNISESGEVYCTFTMTATGTAYLQLGTGNASHSIDAAMLNISVKEVLTSAQDFDFTRASEATRVLSGGRIEKVRTNSLLQSNDFDTTWTLNNSSLTSGQSGYDGTNDAWLVTATNTFSARVQQNEGLTGVQVLSVYAKAATANFIVSEKAGTSGFYAWFDLSNGTIGNTSGDIDTTIEDFGDGWYRCSVSGNPSTSSKSQFFVAETNGSTTISVGASIYIQNAQLEQGLVATEYIATTSTSVSVGSVNDMPRLDWSGGCPALLLEPSRTNLVPSSEYFGGWIIQSGTVVSHNTTETLSPDGFNNAAKVTSNGSNGLFPASVSGAGGVNTKSVYLKGVSGGEQVYIKDPYETIISKLCTLTTEWQRFESTETQASSMSIWIDDIPVGGIYMWGAQLEAGSYATSYIPSYGTATTRAVDVCSKTGISSLIGQTEGTMFFQGEVDQYPENVNVMTYNRQTTFSVPITKRSDGTILAQVFNSAVSIINLQTSSSVSGKFKVAFAYKSGDTTLYVNGTQIGTSSVAFTPAASVDQVYIGTQPSSYFAYQHTVKCGQSSLFTTRLSDTELEKLTTL